MDNTNQPDYWQDRYLQADMPWDIGTPSPPLMHYARQYSKQALILLPGAGRGHDAIALHEEGYSNIWVCDWASAPLEYIRRQAPRFPEDHLLQRDFFELTGSYDLILEQTFFSALPPPRRTDYAQKMHSLLKKQGRLAGLLFARPFAHSGPPYGGTAEEYRRLFESHFRIHQLQLSEHSIPPRLGNELFIELSPK